MTEFRGLSLRNLFLMPRLSAEMPEPTKPEEGSDYSELQDQERPFKE
jgi:hypothetical protein